MKWIKFVVAGFYFGFILIKSEAISWYRIVEMFHFQSFPMFGIIGSAVGAGAISVLVIKKLNQSVFKTQPIDLTKKPFHLKAHLLGGLIFGLGWSLVGACPGPLFVHLGAGNTIILIPVLFAVLGTYFYGRFKDSLPH
mgnify:FL=1